MQGERIMRRSLFAGICLLLAPLLIAQQVLNNDSIIKLVKAGLSEDLIISTINASPGSYDTSANGLIELKSGGASDKMISAIVVKASGATPAASPAAAASNASPASAPGRPQGIDDIGVYYKDKAGAWISLMPEVVNFKTGGVVKSIATVGVMKGDINGHVQGARAKLTLTLPVTLAVYVPEGVAITEYQLLRLHPNSGSREFRSVTGGVLHVSGGATRDLLDLQNEKIAPRVYQVILQSSLGKGEYGLLPPGAYGSSNMGSSGKIYSVSVPE
jgi:hypothetical protein